jgi:nucleoside-diphosphate-sugar epimerase
MGKIFITGSNGFLGNIILNVLRENFHLIKTIGRSKEHNIFCDLAQSIPKLDVSFNTVIHVAGKAHSVPETTEEKQQFFNVNVNGTFNLLSALEKSGIPQSFVFISTVAVYGRENGILINENEPLLAKDSYGQSKIQAEKLIQTWCKKYNVTCTILRLPLIAGPNPPGNLASMIKGIKKGYYFNIDGGKAKKSIVLADDVANIIPKAAEIGGIFNLTDGYHPSLNELSSVIAQQLNKKMPGNIPAKLVKSFAIIFDMLGKLTPINSYMLKKITSDLTFDDSKAREILGWNPKSVLEKFKIR